MSKFRYNTSVTCSQMHPAASTNLCCLHASVGMQMMTDRNRQIRAGNFGILSPKRVRFGNFWLFGYLGISPKIFGDIPKDFWGFWKIMFSICLAKILSFCALLNDLLNKKQKMFCLFSIYPTTTCSLKSILFSVS